MDKKGEVSRKDSEARSRSRKRERESESSSSSHSPSSSHSKKKSKNRKHKSKEKIKKKKKSKKSKKSSRKSKSKDKCKEEIIKCIKESREKPSTSVEMLVNKGSDSRIKKKGTGELAPALIQEAKRFAPKSQAEWEKEQSVVRKEVDEQTGRVRLIKGSGEVLETIVSRQQHKEINRSATKQDGEQFQLNLMAKLK